MNEKSIVVNSNNLEPESPPVNCESIDEVNGDTGRCFQGNYKLLFKG